MKTEVISSKKFNKAIQEANNLLNKGEIIALPTETVYGLAGSIKHEDSISKIYKIKNRPRDNPLIVHIGMTEQLNDLVEEIPEITHNLIKKYWPGPLTLIFKKNKNLSLKVTAGLETIAIRMPSHKIAREIAKHTPFLAPSANISGYISPVTAQQVLFDLNNKIPLIIDDGRSSKGIESTIINLTSNPIQILRPGPIGYNELQKIINITKEKQQLNKNEKPVAPGMKYKHYSPKTKLLVFDDGKSCPIADKNTTIIIIGKVKQKYLFKLKKLSKKIYHLKNHIEAEFHTYNILRKEDIDKNTKKIKIFFEKETNNKNYEAIKNRIYKAAHKLETINKKK
jgi:L-threonylcarbamoyladenylate synthase